MGYIYDQIQIIKRLRISLFFAAIIIGGELGVIIFLIWRLFYYA